MNSTLTIDGTTIHGDSESISNIYSTVVKIIESGHSETLVCNSRNAQSDEITKRLIHISPTSAVSAVLSTTSDQQVPEFPQNIVALALQYS